MKKSTREAFAAWQTVVGVVGWVAATFIIALNVSLLVFVPAGFALIAVFGSVHLSETEDE